MSDAADSYVKEFAPALSHDPEQFAELAEEEPDKLEQNSHHWNSPECSSFWATANGFVASTKQHAMRNETHPKAHPLT